MIALIFAETSCRKSRIERVEASRLPSHDQRFIRDGDGPEQTRMGDPGVEVVHLRARTGLEQVDSDEPEGAVLVRAVGSDVDAAVDSHIGLHVEAIALTVGGAPGQVGHGGEAVEVRPHGCPGLTLGCTPFNRASASR